MKRIDEKTTDELIIKRVKRGDIEAFRHIVERYQKKIFYIGLRFFNNIEDSNDFTQEIFIKAFEKIGTYKEASPFVYWLTRIAYNHGINKKKIINKDDKFESEINSSDNLTPEKIYDDSELSRLLLSEINRLPEKYRICLDFYFFLGLSYREISRITEIPVNTIKSNVLRSKKILRERLKDTIGESYYEM